MPSPDRTFGFRKTLIGSGLLLVLVLPFVYSAIVVPLSPWEQVEVSLALIGFALLASHNRTLRPLIIFLSCFASARYLYWRVSSTLEMGRPEDALVSSLLLGAECYGLLVLFLGYFQTIELRERPPALLNRTPTVDVFIPTYNEGCDIVRRTVIGALALDYPMKRVFVLDDGRRPEMERLAAELGCEYLTRPDNRHAKAGNLNHALAHTDGDLIAILDADHVPVRGFLRKTAGFFEDEKIALVQAAQHFFNPDPYERNLKLTGRIAPEQTFFYDVVQPGNDFWNSAFFCGSCAVLRRSAVLAIGGFRTDTVTEDAHTALELHARGYESAYLALPLAAGLATETFAAHVKQRTRWARGMAQILRLDPPLLKSGLTLAQRLNYLSAMLHFFFGVPRLIMILAPLTYLLLGLHPIKADVFAVFAYILPHIGLSTLGNSLLSQGSRHSFWAGVYEVSIAPYVAGVTTLALLNPRLGRFEVTDKGASLEHARFDARTSRGTLLLLGLSALALGVALPWRLLQHDSLTGDPNVLHAILINGFWAFGNLVILVAAACVGYEQPQQRRAPRAARDFPCELSTSSTERWPGTLVDVSEHGARVRLATPGAIPGRCNLVITSDHVVRVSVRAERRWSDWGSDGSVEVALRFLDVDEASARRLVELIFSGDTSWLRRTYPIDEPLRSFGYLVSTVFRVTEPRQPRTRRAPRVEGDWRCTVGGVRARCRSISPFGAGILGAGALSPDATVELALELPGRGRLEARGRVLRRGHAGGVILAFEWREDAARAAFARRLYGAAGTGRPWSGRRLRRRLGVSTRNG